MKIKRKDSIRVKELKAVLDNFDPEAKVTLTTEGITYFLWEITKFNDDCDLGGGWVPLKENE